MYYLKFESFYFFITNMSLKRNSNDITFCPPYVNKSLPGVLRCSYSLISLLEVLMMVYLTQYKDKKTVHPAPNFGPSCPNMEARWTKIAFFIF